MVSWSAVPVTSEASEAGVLAPSPPPLADGEEPERVSRGQGDLSQLKQEIDKLREDVAGHPVTVGSTVAPHRAAITPEGDVYAGLTYPKEQ